jgi:hypothetical protein
VLRIAYCVKAKGNPALSFSDKAGPFYYTRMRVLHQLVGNVGLVSVAEFAIWGVSQG